MAWNTEQTRAKLLAAATRDFAEHGFAGGRIDRIAADAGVNKERIYQYFDNKEGLFEAVIGAALGDLIASVPFVRSAPDADPEATGVDDVAVLAGGLFDHIVDRPEIARLLFWEGLERHGVIADVSRRLEACQQRIDAIAEALGAARSDAAGLLLSATTLCAAWVALPQLAVLMADGEASSAWRREGVVATVRAAAASASTVG